MRDNHWRTDCWGASSLWTSQSLEHSLCLLTLQTYLIGMLEVHEGNENKIGHLVKQTVLGTRIAILAPTTMTVPWNKWLFKHSGWLPFLVKYAIKMMLIICIRSTTRNADTFSTSTLSPTYKSTFCWWISLCESRAPLQATAVQSQQHIGKLLPPRMAQQADVSRDQKQWTRNAMFATRLLMFIGIPPPLRDSLPSCQSSLSHFCNPSFVFFLALGFLGITIVVLRTRMLAILSVVVIYSPFFPLFSFCLPYLCLQSTPIHPFRRGFTFTLYQPRGVNVVTSPSRGLIGTVLLAV